MVRSSPGGVPVGTDRPCRPHHDPQYVLHKVPRMILTAAVPAGPPPPGLFSLAEDNYVAALQRGSGERILLRSSVGGARPSRIARQIMADGATAEVVIDVPATCGALVARALTLVPVEAYGMAQVLADALIQVCQTRVALNSVSKLADPRPTLMQHACGFLPGTSFEVDIAAKTVTTIGSSFHSETVTWNTGTAQATCWAAASDLGRVKVSVVGAATPIVLSEEAVGNRYGVKHWAELSVIGDPMGVLRAAYTSTPSLPCVGCRRRVPLSGCPFCGTSAPRSGASAVAPPPPVAQPMQEGIRV